LQVLGIAPQAWVVAGERQRDRSGFRVSRGVRMTVWFDSDGQARPSVVRKVWLHRRGSEDNVLQIRDLKLSRCSRLFKSSL
jgi:hypothetical protein